MSKARRIVVPIVTLVVVFLAVVQVAALTQKEALDQLDLLVFVSPELRVPETLTDVETIRGQVDNIAAMDNFRVIHGDAWRFILDQRRGVPTILDGGAIPFIPGVANDIDWQTFAPGCSHVSCLPLEKIETIARDFLRSNEEIFKVADADLVLDPMGSQAVGSSMYFLRFQWHLDGIPIEGASLYFRINNGNLIQVATTGVGSIDLDTSAKITPEEAQSLLQEFLGPYASAADQVSDKVRLKIIPVTPAGQDPDDFTGPIGSGIDYRLVYSLSFQRPGVIGSWEGVVDAHSGDLLRFVDTIRYGRIHGGAYPGENHVGEADRPLPFADTGLPAPNDYADSGGLFDGDNATTTLTGKYTWIDDTCGSISNTTTVGDVDFMLGPGTDCDVPSGNTGGSGNTHSARTLYYHVTNVNIKARTYMPTNSWLTTGHMNINTNQSPWCNATSGSGTLNFYRADTGCWNLGEIPGVALHEWGHSMDDFDGSGGGSRPVETRADWTGILQTHDSCLGRGFFLSGNCGGYGDPCLDCNGIRDADYTMHSAGVPWTTDNYGTVWSCSGGSYYGPCGWGDHCESGFTSQAIWDLVVTDLVGPPTNMDLTSAWQLVDRLFYSSMSSLGDMYTCPGGDSDGCVGGGLYMNFMAIDDDGDGTANGTPHAAAIFAALDRHGIACGTASDPENQNQTSCPPLAAATVTGTGGNNQAVISWAAVTNATRYFIYRNEIDCDAGYTKVGEVAAPTTIFTDTTVVNGFEYYYRVQAAAASDSCVGAMSDCETVMPVPCETPAAPLSLNAAADGDNRILLSWSSSDPVADTFNVYRAVGSCPQSEYELIASDLATTTFADDPVSGQVDFAYLVTAADVTQGCESLPSNCSSVQTTGPCTLGPSFDGVQSVSTTQDTTCTLELSWNAASSNCGGSISYNIYRDTVPGIDPDMVSPIVSGVGGTTYSDSDSLVSWTPYYYVVRAEDSANSSEDSNLVEDSAVPYGPGGMSTTLFTEDFEAARAFSDWAVTTGPGAHTCGDWERTSSTTQRPAAGSGFYALTDSDDCGWGSDTSTTLTSPVIDCSTVAANAVLTYDYYYRAYDGDDTTVEVWDGSSWVVIWSDNNSDEDSSHTWDVTAYAAGNPSFQIRFNYQNASWDYWFAVDNVELIGDTAVACTTGSCTDPGQPSISSITDNDSCAQDGVTVSYNPGSGAVSHDLYVDGSLAVSGFVSGAIYVPMDDTSHSYVIRAVDQSCFTDSSSQAFADTDNSPGTPGISSITDDDACAQTGIRINYTVGSGATSHDLLRDGSVVVTGYTSGALYNPGGAGSFTYTVRANNGACTAISGGQAFADTDGTPGTPGITGIVDEDDCAQTGIRINYSTGAGATSHDLVREGIVVVPGYVSGDLYDPGTESSYTYVVRAANGGCTTDSLGQAFADQGPTEPAFTGLGQLSQISWSGGCGLLLNWDDATSSCSGGADVVYNVYRSTTPGFVPNPATNMLAWCVTDTWLADDMAFNGNTYYYVVRAEDSTTGGSGPCNGGNEDSNLVEMSATAGNGTLLGFQAVDPLVVSNATTSAFLSPDLDVVGATAATLDYGLVWSPTQVLPAADFVAGDNTVTTVDLGESATMSTSRVAGAELSYTVRSGSSDLIAVDLVSVHTMATSRVDLPTADGAAVVFDVSDFYIDNGPGSYQLSVTMGNGSASIIDTALTLNLLGANDLIANTRVDLIGPNGGLWTIKDFTDPNPAMPVDVLAYYNDTTGGIGVWQIALFEDASGTAELTDAVMAVTGATCLGGDVSATLVDLTPVRSDISGTLVEAIETAGGTVVAATLTDAGGAFAFSNLPPDAYTIRASHDMFLWADRSVDLTAGSNHPLSNVTLIGGDFDGSGDVAVVDVTYVASRYGTGDLTADLNDNGGVDIVDISATASAYGATAPLLWP